MRVKINNFNFNFNYQNKITWILGVKKVKELSLPYPHLKWRAELGTLEFLLIPPNFSLHIISTDGLITQEHNTFQKRKIQVLLYKMR